MPGITITISGLDNLEERLRAGIPKARQNVKAELYQFAEEVLAVSKERVPVDTGALMSTGKVNSPVEEGTRISVTMGYGDESVGYALYVHEALEGPHAINPNWSWAKHTAAGGQINWTRPGSGPKYLTGPLQEKQDSLPPRILDALKAGFTS